MVKKEQDLEIQSTDEHIRIFLSEKVLEDLGEIMFLSLPKVGDVIQKNQPFSEVEAEKAVTEFVAPMDGKVIAVNEAALNQPNILNEYPSDAWLVALQN